MSPLRARKSLGGKWFRVNFTLRSVIDWVRDWQDDGHVAPGRRPWSSITIGPRGWSWNTRRRTARVDLPGPFSWESRRLDLARFDDDGDPDDGCRLCGGLPGDRSRHWPGCSLAIPTASRGVDENGRRWERIDRPDGGSATSYLPDPVTDAEALEQSCPRCGAEVCGRCRTRAGRPTKPHMPRVELARLARAYPESPDRQFSCEHSIPADTSCELCDVTPPWGTAPR